MNMKKSKTFSHLKAVKLASKAEAQTINNKLTNYLLTYRRYSDDFRGNRI